MSIHGDVLDTPSLEKFVEKFVEEKVLDMFSNQWDTAGMRLQAFLNIRIEQMLSGDWASLRNALDTAISAKVRQMTSEGVALIRFDCGRYLLGDVDLDAKHPEGWGNAILARLAEKKLS